jgi:hypothetical protein
VVSNGDRRVCLTGVSNHFGRFGRPLVSSFKHVDIDRDQLTCDRKQSNFRLRGLKLPVRAWELLCGCRGAGLNCC